MANSGNIVTPCCGAELLVLTEYVSSGYYGEERVSEIMCQGDKCYNTWQPNGTADEWNKYGEDLTP